MANISKHISADVTKLLLVGDSGSGKTAALAALANAGKNLRIFNGKPLIAWPIIAATRCKNIDTVIVTTDSEEIATQAKLFGASVPALRPHNLAQDDSTTETTLKDSLDKFEKLTNQYFDICVFLTCTDIFRDTDWITNAVEKLKSNPTLESVFSAHPTHKNYWKRDSNQHI